MLALTRRPGESIHIGPDIIVHVVRIQRGQVRIGITAPKDVHIVRNELVEREKESEQS